MSNDNWVFLYCVLLGLALVCFVAEAWGPRAGTTRRISLNLLALGLAFWVTVPLLSELRAF